MATDLTSECKAGYEAAADTNPPYFYSSAAWMGFKAGQAVSAMSGVRRCRMGRGYTVNVDTTGGNRVVVTFDKTNMHKITINRL